MSTDNKEGNTLVPDEITATEILNSQMLSSFSNYISSNGIPVTLPPEPTYEEPSAWDDEVQPENN